MEPEFDEVIDSTFVSSTNLTAHGPIYLAKEDNVQSEQTFRIAVQVADSVPSGENINPATFREDYLLGPLFFIEFLPSMQRVNIPFILFSDVSPEGTEAFRASSSATATAAPIALHAETFVIIEDNDRKARVSMEYTLAIIVDILISAVIIGFEETNYTVLESMGMLQVNVSVITPSPGVELLDAGIQSVAITASKC